MKTEREETSPTFDTVEELQGYVTEERKKTMNEPKDKATVPSVDDVVLLPCPFCGTKPEIVTHNGYGDEYDPNAEYTFGTPFSVRCGRDIAHCTSQPYSHAGISVEVAISWWNTRCVDGHVVTFHRERPGVIAPEAVWVVVQDGYMYGPCERWQDVEAIIRNEWKAGSCLVG